MKKSNHHIQINSLEDGSKNLYHFGDGVKCHIILDYKNKIIEVYHSNLNKVLNNSVNNLCRGESLEVLGSLSIGLIYQSLMKRIIEDDNIPQSEINDIEGFIDGVELQESPTDLKPLNNLRSIFLENRFPESGGSLKHESFKGHLICRCYGVSKEEISTFLKENSDQSLVGLNIGTSAGTGCGSCTGDLKEIYEDFHSKQSPSPIEWMILVDECMQNLVGPKWGDFLKVESGDIFHIKLKDIEQKQFLTCLSEENIPLEKMVFI